MGKKVLLRMTHIETWKSDLGRQLGRRWLQTFKRFLCTLGMLRQPGLQPLRSGTRAGSVKCRIKITLNRKNNSRFPPGMGGMPFFQRPVLQTLLIDALLGRRKWR